jgi:hypothetical protein
VLDTDNKENEDQDNTIQAIMVARALFHNKFEGSVENAPIVIKDHQDNYPKGKKYKIGITSSSEQPKWKHKKLLTQHKDLHRIARNKIYQKHWRKWYQQDTIITSVSLTKKKQTDFPQANHGTMP